MANVVKVNPTATISDVRLALQRLSPSGEAWSGVLCSICRSDLEDEGAVVRNSFASIAALGERLWFGDIMHKHN